jgi:uncharacterized protein (DUF1684 family)
MIEIYLTGPKEGRAGWRRFREARDRLFREHPQSALEHRDRERLDTLPFFEYDERYRVQAALAPVDDAEELNVETGGDDGVLRYRRVARAKTPFGVLTIFWLTGYGGGLFMPFRDSTSGAQTYGGGRYLLDTIKGTFGRGVLFDRDVAVLDFNYAYNPSCAYNPRYACPLPPRENWLSVPILAGERAYRRDNS